MVVDFDPTDKKLALIAAKSFTKKVDSHYSEGDTPAIFGDSNAQEKVLDMIEEGIVNPNIPENIVDMFVETQVEIAEMRVNADYYARADLVGELGVLSRGAINMRLIRIAMRMEKGNMDEVPGYAVVLVDLDGLKTINDALGHQVGDRAIRNLARVLTESVRLGTNDEVVRLGGDEMLVLMEIGETAAIRAIEGSDSGPGIEEKMKEWVVEGLGEIKETLDDRWPDSIGDSEPGSMSLGWYYLTREELVEKYQDWKLKSKHAKADFVGEIVVPSDGKMYVDKKTRKGV